MKTKLPSLVTVLIFTVITSVSWVGFSIYRAIIIKPSPSVSEEISEDIDPNLDSAVIEKVKSKLFLSEEEIPQTEIQLGLTPASIPTQTPSSTPTPSPSGSLTPTPNQTEIPTETTPGESL